MTWNILLVFSLDILLKLTATFKRNEYFRNIKKNCNEEIKVNVFLIFTTET